MPFDNDSLVSEIFLKVYPIGAIYMSVNSTDPSILFGGTWVSWGEGKVPVGVDSTDTRYDNSEISGGSSSHTLTANEMPTHTHSLSNGTVSTKTLEGTVGNMAMQSSEQGLSASGIASLLKWNNTRLGYAEKIL